MAKDKVVSDAGASPFSPLPNLVEGGDKPPMPKIDNVDEMAIAAAQNAGIIDPAMISDSETSPSLGNVNNRLQNVDMDINALQTRCLRLEALMRHIFQTHFRNVDPDAILKEHLEMSEGSEVLDPTMRGRA